MGGDSEKYKCINKFLFIFIIIIYVHHHHLCLSSSSIIIILEGRFYNDIGQPLLPDCSLQSYIVMFNFSVKSF